MIVCELVRLRANSILLCNREGSLFFNFHSQLLCRVGRRQGQFVAFSRYTDVLECLKALYKSWLFSHPIVQSAQNFNIGLFRICTTSKFMYFTYSHVMLRLQLIKIFEGTDVAAWNTAFTPVKFTYLTFQRLMGLDTLRAEWNHRYSEINL